VIDIFYGKTGATYKQVEFRDAAERYKLYGGAIGGGKSYAICTEAIRYSLMFPGNRGFLCRSEAKAFKDTTLVTLLSRISDIEGIVGYKILSERGHGKGDQEIEFITKSIILYGGLSGRDNHNKVKSMELGFYGVDEATECEKDDIDMLESRLRWRLPNGEHPPFVGMYASNPEPGWVKRIFVVPQQIGKKEEDRIFVQALPGDNKWLPDRYVERLAKGKPDYWVKKYLAGSWDAAEGQVWPQFDYNIHVFPNASSKLEIRGPEKGDERHFASFDHGQSHPACLLAWRYDNDGNLFIYDEYYSSGLVSYHCNEIKSKFDIGEFRYMSADPSIWKKDREKDGGDWSLFEEYSSRGITFVKADNARAAGINRIGELLTVDEDHPHPLLEGVMGSPRVFISAKCFNLIRELPEYNWKKQKGEAKEDAVKYNDDAVDALRYGGMSRPAPIFKEKKGAPFNSFAYWLNRINKGHKGIGTIRRASVEY
jgi:hypothetical protein